VVGNWQPLVVELNHRDEVPVDARNDVDAVGAALERIYHASSSDKRHLGRVQHRNAVFAVRIGVSQLDGGGEVDALHLSKLVHRVEVGISCQILQRGRVVGTQDAGCAHDKVDKRPRFDHNRDNTDADLDFRVGDVESVGSRLSDDELHDVLLHGVAALGHQSVEHEAVVEGDVGAVHALAKNGVAI
jgi:hypothetical protein